MNNINLEQQKVKSTSLSFGRHGDFGGVWCTPVDGSAIFGFDMRILRIK